MILNSRVFGRWHWACVGLFVLLSGYVWTMDVSSEAAGHDPAISAAQWAAIVDRVADDFDPRTLLGGEPSSDFAQVLLGHKTSWSAFQGGAKAALTEFERRVPEVASGEIFRQEFGEGLPPFETPVERVSDEVAFRRELVAHLLQRLKQGASRIQKK